jgi:hypothetical protein
LVVGVEYHVTVPVRSGPVATRKMARMQDPVVGTQLKVLQEGQLRQEEDPTAVVNVLAGHGRHAGAPLPLKVPAEHCVHEEEPGGTEVVVGGGGGA